MRKITTKHGHEWMLPETVGEFQNAGVNLDRLCDYAGQYLRTLMQMRSSQTLHGSVFNPDISGVRRTFHEEIDRTKDRVSKITQKLTPELRAALLAELTKEPTNG